MADAGFPARPASFDAPAPKQDGEAAGLRRDLILAGALTLPVFLLAMGGHMVPAVHRWIADTIGIPASWGIQFVLTTAVLVGPGRRFHRRGWPGLLKGAPDMNALVALGTTAAWAYSTVALLLPGLLPEGSREVYFEAAAVIVTLILLGRWLEARAKGRTGAAIARLTELGETQWHPAPAGGPRHPSANRTCRQPDDGRSGRAQRVFTSRICSSVAQPASRSRGAPKTSASALARETATFIRLRENRNSMPRAVSSAEEAVIDTRQTGASWPWNLSTVPTRTAAGSASRSALTWAL